ncbi:Mediator of RNA polymerase II transcription subunit 7 [Borealophlyctis nickersoniae]|nr:Mediator of RNA polymerase II transcription subunit 7 [Borealophlyctis nickersoniae]
MADLNPQAQGTRPTLPAPPPYFTLYTDENIETHARRNRKRAAGVGEEEGAAVETMEETDSTADDGRPLFLDPPPPIEGDYIMFGGKYETGYMTASLKESGVLQLFPEGRIDTAAELHKLNHSLILNFLELIETLAVRPEQFQHKSADIRAIVNNMHYLLNEYRPHMARDTLRLLMAHQIERRKKTAENIERCCQELESALSSYRQEVTETLASSQHTELPGPDVVGNFPPPSSDPLRRYKQSHQALQELADAL